MLMLFHLFSNRNKNKKHTKKSIRNLIILHMVNGGDEILSHTLWWFFLHLQNTNFHTLIYCLMMNIILQFSHKRPCVFAWKNYLYYLYYNKNNNNINNKKLNIQRTFVIYFLVVWLFSGGGVVVFQKSHLFVGVILLGHKNE